MANNYNKHGLVPAELSYGQPPTDRVAIKSTNATVLTMGTPLTRTTDTDAKGQAYVIASVPGNAELVTGTCIGLYTNKNLVMSAIAASTAGYEAEMTFTEDQPYICTVSTAGYLGTSATSFMNFTAETATVSQFQSTVQLDGTTAASSTRQVHITSTTDPLRNAVATIGTTVNCLLNTWVSL